MSHNREPIGHTCPDIDRLVKGMDEINKLIRGYEKEHEPENLKEIISQIEGILWNYDADLEQLRHSNDALRNWGVSEALDVDRLESRIEELEKELEAL